MTNIPYDSTDSAADDRVSALQRRCAELEAKVGTVQGEVHAIRTALAARGIQIGAPAPAVSAPPSVATSAATPPALPLPAVAAQPQQPAPRRRQFDLVRDSEYWLNKIGIGLLLLGVAFLFKYSIDQGWLTPTIRVLFGIVLGGSLIALGLLLRVKRPQFGQVLQGGGVGVLYVSGFASFQLYRLAPYPVVFSAMCAVTLLAFALAVRQDAVVLALIAALGGLATPFVLYTGSGNIAGLVGYTCLVLAGTSAIYLRKGWRSLLLATFVSGWLIFLVSAVSLPSWLDQRIFERWVLQGGVIFGWIAFGVLPLLRLQLASPTTPPAITKGRPPVLLPLLTLLTPLLALGVSGQTWQLSHLTWGGIVLGVAALYAVATWIVRSRPLLAWLTETHALTALVLLTISLTLLLNGDVLFFALAVEAAVIHYVGARSNSRAASALGHVLSAWLLVWLALQLLDYRSGTAVINPQALTELSGLALMLAASLVLRPRRAASLYWVMLHVLMLAWLATEFGRLFDGSGFVTIAWGVYAIGLLVIGLRRDRNLLVLLGIGSLLLVIGKLFLIDLSELKAIWRIVLFLGFGGVFLALSYFFRALWRPAPKAVVPADQSTPALP